MIPAVPDQMCEYRLSRPFDKIKTLVVEDRCGILCGVCFVPVISKSDFLSLSQKSNSFTQSHSSYLFFKSPWNTEAIRTSLVSEVVWIL